MFSVGTIVSYKNVSGPIVFSTNASISILMKAGSHPSEEVRIVVPYYEFQNVEVLAA
jgi:hypothetical protein